MQFSQPFRTAAQSSQSGAVRETRDCVLHSVTATDSQSGSRFAPFMSGLYAPAASVPALRLRTYAESAEPSGLVILDGSCPSSPLRHSSHLHLRRPDPPVSTVLASYPNSTILQEPERPYYLARTYSRPAPAAPYRLACSLSGNLQDHGCRRALKDFLRVERRGERDVQCQRKT